MVRVLLLSVLFLACSALLSGCGIVSHQLHRAATLLRVPVRLSAVAPAAVAEIPAEPARA